MKDKIIKQLKEYFTKSNITKAVIGLSGGIDSAVCLSLSVQAIGKDNVTAIFMPEINLTSNQNKNDVLNLAKQLGVHIETISINTFLNQAENFPWTQTNLSKMNLKPRIRMLILYNYANSNQALVIGTSNKSEIYLGYGTKYGDCASDILVIGDLYKTQVFKLAKELGIPESIINKAPSAELAKGQTDETEMGITYEIADKILTDFIDKKSSKDKLISKYGQDNVDIILTRFKQHEHKRVAVPIITLNEELDRLNQNKSTALFIGRFQPFHLGHLNAIKQIAKENKKIIIGIGSAQYFNTSDNPFSYEERKKIISKVLNGLVDFEIHPIEDIHDPPNWVDHVNSKLPHYDIVFSANKDVEELFNQKKIPTKTLSLSLNISGKKIRALISNNNSTWKTFVPKEIVNDIEKTIKE